MYRLNKILESDIDDMVMTDLCIDDTIVDDIIDSVESQPEEPEKESLFKPKTDEDNIEESGFLYGSFDENYDNVDFNKIF